MRLIITCLLFILPSINAVSHEENFLFINGVTDAVIYELGAHINERMTPCSTFKIALCVMGFDSGILQDEETPTWPFYEGYDDDLESWRAPQTPLSWIKNSCLWYSKTLAMQLGMEKIQLYLKSWDYGNQDMSGGFSTPAWIKSSLKISPKEQVSFIQKLILGELAISNNVIQSTKTPLFIEELPNGWKLFGKTGWSGQMHQNLEVAWVVGWIENSHSFFPFAYNIRGKKINLPQRIPRVKQLLLESNAMDKS